MEGGPGQTRLAALAALAARPFTTLDEGLNATLRLVGDLLGMGVAMVQRADGDAIVVTHLWDRLGLGVEPPITVGRADTFCDGVLTSLTPLYVRDADADPRYRTLLGKTMIGTRTYIGVPILLSDGRVYGTLCAHDRQVHDFGAAEIDALLILARLVASQIERDEAVHSERESARHLAERNAELAEALRRLDALRETIETISSELDLAELLEQVIASAVRLLDAYGGAISLIGNGLDAPRLLTATYNIPEGVRHRPIPARAGLMGQVIHARGTVIVERYQDLDAPLPDSAFHALGPWAAVPIWWQGEIVGTFGIGANDPARHFGERDIELLTLLAKHAAVAIENARLYAASRDLGAAQERNRLAREIHDTLAQSLLALTFQLRTARGLLPTDPTRADAELADADARVRAALEEARRSVWNLGPVTLEAGTLVEAMQGEIAASERAGLPGKLVVSGAPRPLAAEGQLTLLRIAQEALANARKHARASSVDVTLTYGDSAVTLAVRDDGVGFDPDEGATRPAGDGGFGLIGMRDRVRAAGGELAVESGRGHGTCISAAIPYERPGQPPFPRPPAPATTPGTAIRVVVADDHPATRAGIAALLAGQPDITVVGQAADGEEALRLVAALRPDVLVADLRMPKLSGVETIRRLPGLNVPTRAVAMTTFAQDELVIQALTAGARGYLLKDASPDELAGAVRTVAAGGTQLTPVIAGKLAEGLYAQERLTAREREVLALLARGLPDKEIAATLGTSTKTAGFHVANVLAKLGAQNRTEAVRVAYERGLIEA